MSRVEILFLGTGNAFNSGGRANQTIIIKSPSAMYCIDAGPNALYQMKNYGVDPGDLDYIILTHFHGDHTAAIPFILLHYWQFTPDRPAIPILGPGGTEQLCRNLNNALYPALDLNPYAEYREFSSRDLQNYPLTGDDSVSLFPMAHSPESVGYRFRFKSHIISITGDTRWNSNIPPLVEGADIAVIECTTIEKSGSMHISYEELKENLGKLDAKKIIPVHGSPELSKALHTIKTSKLDLATDGARYILEK